MSNINVFSTVYSKEFFIQFMNKAVPTSIFADFHDSTLSDRCLASEKEKEFVRDICKYALQKWIENNKNNT